MPAYQIFKETSLPGTLQPHSIYLVAPAARPDFVEIYVTGINSATVKRVIDQAQVQAMIDTALSGMGGLSVVDNIAARNALTPTSNALVLVLDASADNTVTSGSATYVYRVSTSSWIKVSESESMDLVFNWSGIQGGPSSTPAQIDAAVSASHSHANLTLLNELSENVQQDLLYRGEPIRPYLTSAEW